MPALSVKFGDIVRRHRHAGADGSCFRPVVRGAFGRRPYRALQGAAMNPTAQTTIISLHGIRTRGQWQKELQAALEDGEFKHRALDFGFFRAISLINPWAREKKVRWFLEQYTQIRATAKGPVSVIAHSFGSYIVAEAMRKFPQITFDRIILCGSIVPVNYDWDVVITNRGQAKEVLNQYGKQDIWVRVAEWAVASAGPSGYKGFKKRAGGAVFEQEFTDYSHSEYFFDGNFRDNWVPFLQGKGVRPQYNLRDDGANWKFRVFLSFLILSFLSGVYLLFSSGMIDGIVHPKALVVPSHPSHTAETAAPVPSVTSEVNQDSSAVKGQEELVSSPAAISQPEAPPLVSVTPSQPAPEWVEQVFQKIEGDWKAKNTYPPIQPPAATFCYLVRSIDATMTFSKKEADSIGGKYRMREIQSISAAIPDPAAPAMCNQMLTGNPTLSELLIDREANVTVMALNGSASELVLKSDFYECKMQLVSNCPPNEIGTYPTIPLRIVGDFVRFTVNDMNFGR